MGVAGEDVQEVRGGRGCCWDDSCGILDCHLGTVEKHASVALSQAGTLVVSRLHWLYAPSLAKLAERRLS